MKVLIIDDVVAMRKSLRTMAKSMGFLVKDTGDPYDALTIVDEFKPDLVIVDIGLPKIDGLELSRIISSKIKTKIIMCTGECNRKSVETAIASGAVDYITKPIDTSRFKMALAKVKNT